MGITQISCITAHTLQLWLPQHFLACAATWHASYMYDRRLILSMTLLAPSVGFRV